MMKKRDKAMRIGEILDRLYPEPPIPLVHKDPFTLLVAVVLSAQTTDVQVNKVTPALFARAPTPEKLAAMDESEILSIIRSCGLAPGKARNIRKLAQTIVDDYGGRVPNDVSALETLPGVGHKTASVVVSQAFGEPAFAVDTHIHRLAWRWGLSSGKNVEQTEHDLKKLFPREEWAHCHRSGWLRRWRRGGRRQDPKQMSYRRQAIRIKDGLTIRCPMPRRSF